MDDKKIPMNEHQWRLFEFNMSRWMVENKYLLDNEEKKKFYKCANYSLGMGALNGSLVYYLCKKYSNYFSPFSRFFLTFSFATYSSMVVNKIYRRKAYTEILTTQTTLSDKAREMMNEVINGNPTNPPSNLVSSNNFQSIQKNTTQDNNVDVIAGANKEIPNPEDQLNLMNDDIFVQKENEFNSDNLKDLSLDHNVKDNNQSDLLNDIDRANNEFLQDSNEKQYVSWDEIRKRNS